MAPRPNNDRAPKSGITHFPLREEQESQNRVPDPGQSEPPAGSRGHRLSRSSGSQQLTKSEGLFEGKGGKGGKTGGSRAGLLSASRKVQKGRT
jgi:hypothetical protein